VGTAAYASASPLDDSFLAALRDSAVTVPVSVDPIPAAHDVCTDLKKGTPAAEIAATKQAAGFPNPAAFVDVAIGYYCPEYTAWGTGPVGAGG
jgi:hypothetical protein